MWHEKPTMKMGSDIQENEHKIYVPEEKLDLLGLLDKTNVQYYHWTALIVAGCGFYTDAYDLFSMSTVSNLLGRLYFYDASSSDLSQPGVMPMEWQAMLDGVALLGAAIGCIFFGFLGDKIGRKCTYCLALVFMILGSIGSGLAYGKNGKVLMTIVCFFRFWLGFGVGGSFPVSACIMAEYANVKSRGALLGVIFAMQGCGTLSAAGVATVVSWSFKKIFTCEMHRTSSCIAPLYDTPKQADYVWRITLLVGAIPAICTLVLHAMLPETPRYTVLVEGDVKKATENMNKLLNIRLSASLEETNKWKAGINDHLFTRSFASKFGLRLVAVGCCFFLAHLSFFMHPLFQKEVLLAVGWLPRANQMDGLGEVSLISQALVLLAMLASIPGLWVTVCTVEWLGRRLIQLQGFFFLTVFCLIIGLFFYPMRGVYCGGASSSEGIWCGGHPTIFIALSGALFFFVNFGARATTFISSPELFPTRVRSTCVGIGACAGKIGSLVGTSAFVFIKLELRKLPADAETKLWEPGFPAGFIVLGCLCALGFLITFFFVPETMEQSLEVLTLEESLENSFQEESSHQSGIDSANQIAVV